MGRKNNFSPFETDNTKYDELAAKIASLLAESKTNFDDVDWVFAKAKGMLTVSL